MAMPLALRKLLKKQDKRLPKALEQVFKEQDKNHKYGAKRTECLYGHSHDSRKEAIWCLKLNEMEKEGKISLLVLEPVVVIVVQKKAICKHLPDFMFFDQQKQRQCFLDVKGDWEGGKRPEWTLKRKLCEALYPHIEYQVV